MGVSEQEQPGIACTMCVCVYVDTFSLSPGRRSIAVIRFSKGSVTQQ